MKFHYRWIALILYAISPILVHGTELGRPDHQSQLILLLPFAICAEWSLRAKNGAVVAKDHSNWSIASEVAWALAIWTSAYESLVLLMLVMVVTAVENPKAISARSRRIGWGCFLFVIVIALLIERRVPSFLILSSPLFQNWSHTIGELAHVLPANPIWLRWTGYLLFVAPFLIWINATKARPPREPATPAFVSRASRYHLYADNLAGAVEILLCTAFCSGAADFARAD
jgi:hypothetical protein